MNFSYIFLFHNVSAPIQTVQVNQILLCLSVPSPNLHENRGHVLIVASCVLLEIVVLFLLFFPSLVSIFDIKKIENKSNAIGDHFYLVVQYIFVVFRIFLLNFSAQPFPLRYTFFTYVFAM